MRRTLRLGVAAIAIAALAGCSTMRSPDARDPWEGLNRATFEFNDGLDRAVIRPVAEGYRFVMPTPARDAITNFFANLKDPWIAVNQLLQGKPRLAIDDLGPPPCPLSWLALGSLGRRVVVPSSDVDSALAFDDDTDDDETRAYMVRPGGDASVGVVPVRVR